MTCTWTVELRNDADAPQSRLVHNLHDVLVGVDMCLGVVRALDDDKKITIVILAINHVTQENRIHGSLSSTQQTHTSLNNTEDTVLD